MQVWTLPVSRAEADRQASLWNHIPGMSKCCVIAITPGVRTGEFGSEREFFAAGDIPGDNRKIVSTCG
jgi:hypothetical protein